MELRGCGTALVTPFRHDGAVDEAAFGELVTWQVESGIDFLVPCGTTGETPTLSRKEWLRVIDLAVEAAAGRVPIVAGATSNSTREAIEKARSAASRPGVDAILTASPYYNKPTQEGQFQHFRAIAQAVPKPIILYNVPGRTGANLEPTTLTRLAALRNIVGVKEASGNISQIAEVFNAVPAGFRVFSGDDAITLPVIALGGAGIISVASNEIPREMAEMTRAALSNDWDTARCLHRRYLALMQVNFIEPNPMPVKAVLAMMGKIREIYRLPLVRMKDETRLRLHKIAAEAGLPLRAGAEASPLRARETRRPRAAEAVATENSVENAPVTVPADYATASPQESVAQWEQEAQHENEVIAAEAAVANLPLVKTQGGDSPAASPTEDSVPAWPTPEIEPAKATEQAPPGVGQPSTPVTQAAAPQPPPAAAREPARFFVFESWSGGPHKTILHRSTCASCNHDDHAKAESNNARWHGPFENAQQAREASRSLTGVLIRSECKCVSRR
jgi:4-hydroxy-tetrahydrodipicolinate synthase